jgi:hypothetical protein
VATYSPSETSAAAAASDTEAARPGLSRPSIMRPANVGRRKNRSSGSTVHFSGCHQSSRLRAM